MTKSGIKKKKDFVFSFILNYLQNPFVPREGLEPLFLIFLRIVSNRHKHLCVNALV